MTKCNAPIPHISRAISMKCSTGQRLLFQRAPGNSTIHGPAPGFHFSFDLRGDVRPFGQPLKIPMHRHLEQRQHRQVTVHRVRVRGGARRRQIIKRPRPFPGAFTRVVQPDGQPGIGQPGKDAAAGQPLQINRPIEVLRPACLRTLASISGQRCGAAQRLRSKGIIPAKSGSSSSNGTRLASSHQ